MGEPLLRVLSLGAGVQSSTLALMASVGEIGPMPLIMPDARYFSMPSSVVGGAALRKAALNPS